MELVRYRGCGVNLPGNAEVTGLGRSATDACRQNCAGSSSLDLSLVANYVGLRAEQRTQGVLKTTIAGLRISKVRGLPQNLPSGSKLHRWRAEGIQLPNPSVFWEGVKNPLLQSFQGRGKLQNTEAEAETKIYFAEERTIGVQFTNGELSTAAIDCVEQFSRLNGLTGKQTRSNFEISAPQATQNEAQNLVEFACFRYLARCNVELHPALKDAAFRRLTFSAMLAWQRPYKDDILHVDSEGQSLPRIGLVGEEAFIRIAPAIAGAADCATAHCLYRALVGELEGLSFNLWDRYCLELCKVQKLRDEQLDVEGRKRGLQPGEFMLFVNADTRQPVQKWSKNNAWPGRLTLTERALYFEANGLTHYQKATRLDLAGSDTSVKRKKVGPFGLELFDSAILVSADKKSEPWTLDFVDFSGEGRLNVWLAMIKEIFAVYAFIAEYGVKEDDPLLNYVHGAKNGRKKVLSAVMIGIARLQAVHAVLGKFPAHPEGLLQFSFLANAPIGEIARQALAVSFWGGRIEGRTRDPEFLVLGGNDHPSEDAGGLGSNIHGTDGTVYLRKWAKSKSWSSGKCHTFWKSKPGNNGLILGKNHVVGGETQVQKAVRLCWDQTVIAERTQATIDGALLKGVPPNVDLLQELLLPFSVAGAYVRKLKKWENPGATVTFLFFAYGVIYMNWLKYALPSLLLSGAVWILTLRALQAGGHLEGGFGNVTIREQPETNTIQKIMALKEALNGLEDFLQTCNIVLLKLRTIVLYREARVTNQILWGLLAAGTAMFFVPFRFFVAFFIADQFTNELKFREKSRKEMFQFLGEKWSTIPAAPVVVLPPEKRDGMDIKLEEIAEDSQLKGDAVMQAMSEWLGEENPIVQFTGGSR